MTFTQRTGKAIKGRYFKGKGYGNPKLVQIAKDVSMLKSLVNVEKKFLDVSTSGTTLASGVTGNVDLLSGCGQGDTVSSRDGLSIKYVSFYIEGFVQLNGSTQDEVKVSLILDKQVNASLPTYGQIFDLSVVTGSIALRNFTTVDRFVVLRQVNLSLNNNGNQLKKFSFFLKIPYHEKFNGVGTTIASIYTNALYLAYCGDNTTDLSVIDYFARIRYVDN